MVHFLTRPFCFLLYNTIYFYFFNLESITLLYLLHSYLQVFVANPNKTQPVLDILLKNQSKLIEFLSKFQNDRTEDEQFNDEKTYLVKQIRDLKRPTQQEP